MSDSTPNYDVTIIGGGPGGYVAAIRARQLGLRVALVERDRLGGTCLHWGCIPTKTMHRTADLVRSLRRAGEYGIEVEGWRVDYGAVLRRRQQVVDQLAGGVEQLMRANGVDVFRGRGLPTSPRRVLVAGNDGSTATLDTKHLILATGSRSTRPPIPGIDLEGVVDSDGLLGLQELPPSLVVVGGGVVGVEFASILAALGSRVTVLEMLPYILPPVDRELAQRLLVFLRRAGVECHTEARVLAVERAAEGLAVRAETREGERVFTGSVVLVATGRAPEFGGIDLDALGVLHNRGGIRVDETMRTSADGVYAVGDVTGQALLAHVASHGGVVAAEAIAGRSSRLDLSAVPNCVFSLPEVASVGLSEDEARRLGVPPKISKFPFTANGKALALGEAEGLVKVVGDPDGRVLGVHILGPHASDLIAEAAVAVRLGLRSSELAEVIHAHPTLPEAFHEAVLGLHAAPLHAAPARRR